MTARAAGPVTASIRRTPAETPLSPVMRSRPMSPVRRTWVPPQSSIDQAGLLPSASPIETTRTSSPYFSPNKRHRTFGYGGFGRHQAGGDGAVLADAGVDLGLDRGEVVLGDGRRLRHVEAQAVGRVEAALLRHVVAEAAAQGLVQQMRRRVVGADVGAPDMIHFGQHRRTGRDLAFGYAADMDEQVAQLLLRIGDVDAEAGAADGAGIAHLPAALGIERRLVEHDRDLGAGGRLLDRLAAGDHG